MTRPRAHTDDDFCAECGFLITSCRCEWSQADVAICQGCGAYASTARIGEAHPCHRAADGTYEEGGTFQ